MKKCAYCSKEMTTKELLNHECRKTEQTPTPWKIANADSVNSVDISIFGETPKFKNPKWVCRVYGEGLLSKDVSTRNANAAYIVKAVNCHAELLSVLREAKDWVLCSEVREQIIQAITKAEGK